MIKDSPFINITGKSALMLKLNGIPVGKPLEATFSEKMSDITELVQDVKSGTIDGEFRSYIETRSKLCKDFILSGFNKITYDSPWGPTTKYVRNETELNIALADIMYSLCKKEGKPIHYTLAKTKPLGELI